MSLLQPQWSYKKYSMYQQCPFRVKLKYLERLPEPPPDAKGDAARLRGIEMHEEMELAVKGGDIPPYAVQFTEIIENMRENGAKAEEDMFLNNQWQPHNGWPGHWLQVKQDVVVHTDDYLLTGDWKSGKRFGNEHSHYKQMQLYAVAAWRTYPDFAQYTCELYYLDKNDVWTIDFQVPQLEKALRDFDEAVDRMFNDKIFRPRPSKDNCRFCPYGPQGTGACPVGVAK